MLDRRSFLATGAAGMGVSAFAADGLRVAEAAAASPLSPSIAPLLADAPLMNVERAQKVMAEAKLDGLVVGEALNVYHMTNAWPRPAEMGHPIGTWAILSARAPDKPVLVVPSFIYYYTMADLGIRFPDVWMYSAPTDLGAYAALGNGVLAADAKLDAAPSRMLRDVKLAPLGEKEEMRRAAFEAARAAHGLAASGEVALVKALRHLGLDKGRVATDHASIDATLTRAGFTASLVPADNTLRKIRLIKSPTEIELMKRAARNNQAAAYAAVAAVKAGANAREFRAAYFAEAARRGGRGVFMVLDRSGQDQVSFDFKPGQAFAFDAVSEHARYHGDFSRTVYIGEPSAAMKKVSQGTILAWDTIRTSLKPGMRYSEIQALGRETLKKNGYDLTISFTPHSIGLMHTDEPAKEGQPLYVKDDLVLEPNMVLSVDCPLMDAGYGGSSHLEDLTLITKDGGVPINDTGNNVLVV
jgi:Xaa-Pro aminopeptidase